VAWGLYDPGFGCGWASALLLNSGVDSLGRSMFADPLVISFVAGR
jgi:hypothetical protein